VPLRADLYNGLVHLGTDAAAHADDHGFALQGLLALFKVLDDIFGDERYSPVCTGHGLQPGPSALEPLLDGLLFALCDLLEVGVDLGPLCLR